MIAQALTLLVLTQTPVLDLQAAARRAATTHPKIGMCDASVDVARATRDEARAAELPTLSLGAQLNRGTGNVVAGSAFAMPGVPSFSGPPRGATFDTGSWTTVASLTASFEVTAFVRRMRELDASTAALDGEQERRVLCALDAAYDASLAFLDVVALRAALAALEADHDRAEALSTRARALVEATLRPGVELAQAEAELAAVGARSAAARRDLRVAEMRLAETLGTTEVPPIESELPAIAERPRMLEEHPRARADERGMLAADHRTAAVRAGYYPRVEVAAALWARGSSYPGPDGGRLGPSASGLAPDVANWLAGVVVSWDVLDLPEIRARVARAEAESARMRAARDVTRLTLATQLAAARVGIDEAKLVLQHTTPAVSAARAALTQADARYGSGLTSVVDVARVRQLLVDAELAHIAATVSVTRAQVTFARAAGDVAAMTESR